MGTTIRREPVSFKIPDEPDYKYLNITDFRGINKSSNPLTAQYNTASDALNVYVDESNALTTRPRLALKTDLKTLLSLDAIKSVFNISTGYLVQGKVGNSWKLYKVTSTFTYTNITTPPTSTILDVFEQDGKIYFINGAAYYVINGAACSTVEGYIPTIKVGKTLLVNGNDFESPNLLSNKYKESYYWDGTWNPGDLKRKDTDSIENKAKTTKYTSNFTVRTGLRTLESGELLYEDTSDSNALKLLNFSGSSSSQLLSPSTMPSHTRVFGDCDANCENYVYYYYTNETSSSSIDGGVCAYKNSEWLDVLKNNESDFIMTPITENSQHVIRCDYKCDVIAFCYRNSSDDKYYADVYKYNNGSYSQVLHKGYTSQIDINLSRNGNTLVVHYVNSVNNVNYGVFDVYTNLLTSTVITLTQQNLRGLQSTAISYDGSKIFIYARTGVSAKLYDIENNVLVEVELPDDVVDKLSFIKYADFSVDTNNLYILSAMYNEGWIVLNDYTDAVFVEETMSSYNTLSSSYTSSIKIILDYEVSSTYNMFETITYDLSAKEPLIEITRTIDSSDDFYKEWNANTRVKNARLTTRFNNERWFSKDNRTYYTAYNDPTYVPLSSYNINGDNDDITGMNVLSDSILALYKKDDLWLVNQSTDSNGEIQYYYNENNNVVGNEAIGATITTVFSNLPIQITREGIYTIQQQENVSAPDRLAKSLSEAIDEKWLQENPTSIYNAKVLNKMYWTCILLPTYENNEQQELTKVYLFDNNFFVMLVLN